MKRLFCMILVLILFVSTVPMTSLATSKTEEENDGYVASRVQDLANRLDGQYFTTTGKTCGNSKCEKCNMENVVKTKYMKDLVDNFVPAQSVLDPMIKHNYGAGNPFRNGWSCCGFANFAAWYIFAEKTTDKIVFNCICPNGKPISFTEKSLQAVGIRVGDVLRLSRHPENGGTLGKGHSAIFLDFTDDGILVLDSNFRCPEYGDKHCRVRVHTITYDFGYTYICVSRAENYDEINAKTPVVTPDTPEVPENAKLQYRYHMYVNENGKRYVCPYAGQLAYPGTTFELQYSAWLDEPLEVNNGSYSNYVHTKNASCEDFGCIDPSWEGDRYMDSEGKTWICEETRIAEIACEHSWGNEKVTTEATCEQDGEKTYTCSLCGETKTNSITATGHSFGDWVTVVEPTTEAEGKAERKCQNCEEVETKVLDKLESGLPKLGDVNNDGRLSAKDATMILRWVVRKLTNVPAHFEQVADVNGDGKISAKDATMILRFVVGKGDIPGWER